VEVNFPWSCVLKPVGNLHRGKRRAELIISCLEGGIKGFVLQVSAKGLRILHQPLSLKPRDHGRGRLSEGNLEWLFSA
jgi:hypothetical protein